MRWIPLTGLALAAWLSSWPVTAQAPEGCRAWNENPEQAVTGCTELLTFLETTGSAHWLYKERGYAFAYYGRAMAHAAMKHYDQATADFTRSIQNSPHAAAYAMRGIMQSRQGDLSAARQDLQEAARLDPSDEGIKEALASLSAAGQRPARSPADRAAMDTGRQLNGCIRGGDFEDILAACDRVLYGGGTYTSSQRAEAFASRGRVQLYRKKYGGAADDLSEAVKLRPDIGSYQADLAKAKAGVGTPAAVTGAPADLVQRAQRGLARLGYAPGAADGKAGPRTTAAVQAYQRAGGLSVSGEVTPELVARIEAQQP